MSGRSGGRTRALLSGGLVLTVCAVFGCTPTERPAVPAGDLGVSGSPLSGSLDVRVALESIAAGLRGDDPAALGSLIAHAPTSASRTVRGVAAAVRRLPVANLSLATVDQSRVIAADADGTWTGLVRVSYRLAGSSADAEVRLSLESTSPSVTITAWRPGPERLPLWLSGPVRVERRPGVAVITTMGAETLHGIARRAAGARANLRNVLATAPTLLVEAPRAGARLSAAWPGGAGARDGIAAVTTGATIVLNPGEYRPMTPDGKRLLLTHEGMHVATGADTSRAPLWLIEGTADYVALRGLGLPDAVTAARARSDVRRRGVPAGPPGHAAFARRGDRLSAAYEKSWLLVRVVGDRYGDRVVLSWYRRASRGEDVRAALQAAVAEERPALSDAGSYRWAIKAWRDRLSQLAR